MKLDSSEFIKHSMNLPDAFLYKTQINNWLTQWEKIKQTMQESEACLGHCQKFVNHL